MSTSDFIGLVPLMLFFGLIASLVCINAVVAVFVWLRGKPEELTLVVVLREISIAIVILAVLFPLLPLTSVRFGTSGSVVGSAFRIALESARINRLPLLWKVISGDTDLRSALVLDRSDSIGSNTEAISNLVVVLSAAGAGWALFLHPDASIWRLDPSLWNGFTTQRWLLIALTFVGLCALVLMITTILAKLQQREPDPSGLGLAAVGVMAIALVMMISFGGLMATMAT